MPEGLTIYRWKWAADWHVAARPEEVKANDSLVAIDVVPASLSPSTLEEPANNPLQDREEK